MEVYLLGVIVAYVKLIDLARLELGIAVYAFVALILVMVAAEARSIRARSGSGSARRPRPRCRRPQAARLLGCHACDQIVGAPRRTAAPRRCLPALRRRACTGASRTASPAPGRW